MRRRRRFRRRKEGRRDTDAELQVVLALESIVEHGSSILSEDKKVGLVRDYVKMSGLDRGAKKDEPASKRQRTQDEGG